MANLYLLRKQRNGSQGLEMLARKIKIKNKGHIFIITNQ